MPAFFGNPPRHIDDRIIHKRIGNYPCGRTAALSTTSSRDTAELIVCEDSEGKDESEEAGRNGAEVDEGKDGEDTRASLNVGRWSRMC